LIAARCISCGTRFPRRADEHWKTRCYRCWLATKQLEKAPPLPGALAELPQRVRALLQLAHPDRHGGSQLANEITQWLLRVRRELQQ
jgi:hypothetical protein